MQENAHEHLGVALEILNSMELPISQRSILCGNVLLALGNLRPDMSWNEISNPWVRIHDIIQFLRTNYHVVYAENSRETIRKAVLHHFRDAAMIEDNGKATNSPAYSYRLTNEFCILLKTKGTESWINALDEFKHVHASLIKIYSSKKKMQVFPVKINGIDFLFSPGEHNQLQKSILTIFAPRFAPGAECLYVGDTTKKDLYKNDEKLQELGFSISVHDKMPDVVLYSAARNWLYFIEAVTSVGPMAPQRLLEIQELTQNVKAGKIFITAFETLQVCKKFLSQIAWETEVWIAESPEHMIHLDGDRFLEPR